MPLLTTRPRAPRRGITLVEMLVTVALLVLMMTVIVQIFAAATTAVSASRTFQELDGTLRLVDSMIRTDLQNATAHFTPPLNPKDNFGYFEYGENAYADNQGEDTDDYVRLTVKAPEGQLFTGRFYAPPTSGFTTASMSAAQTAAYLRSQPMTITSQYAEVIYFFRNGNLYRRVLLVAPEYQAAAENAYSNATGNTGIYTSATFGGLSVGWQGMNDLSAHPIPTGATTLSGGGSRPFVLNTLGDLTNRENRFAYSRFANDFYNAALGNSSPDSIPDDTNGDSIPDFYPSLYASAAASGKYNVVSTPSAWSVVTTNPDMMAFPYVYPGAYSKPDNSASSGYGWVHGLDPSLDTTVLADLNKLNHSPLDLGDSLPQPGQGTLASTSPTYQTWWGFPTWRETMSPNWNDPYTPIHIALVQPTGLRPPNSGSGVGPYLPPMVMFPGWAGWTTPLRLAPQPYTDGAGSTTFASYVANPLDQLWSQVWEDDLIATGVRSFDVKAYDNSFNGYVDLGWGDDLRLYVPYGAAATPATPPLLAGTASLMFNWPPIVGATAAFNTLTQTYAHEGRIPPLVADLRLDHQNPYVGGVAMNVGDDTAGVVRLRRVWDSWSTDYSYAPASGVNPVTGIPVGPPATAPVYPSYPPPYPMPLRGIQIQIRVVDPRNERVKTLTIRQDFSDKL